MSDYAGGFDIVQRYSELGLLNDQRQLGALNAKMPDQGQGVGQPYPEYAAERRRTVSRGWLDAMLDIEIGITFRSASSPERPAALRTGPAPDAVATDRRSESEPP